MLAGCGWFLLWSRKTALIAMPMTALTVALLFLLRPNRYEKLSETEIKAELLRDVPLSSTSAKVRTYLRRKTGRDAFYQQNFYTYDMFGGPFMPVKLQRPEIPRKVAGAPLRYYFGAAYATLANYGANPSSLFLVSTEVQTRWQFDEKGRLIDVDVKKQMTGP